MYSDDGSIIPARLAEIRKNRKAKQKRIAEEEKEEEALIPTNKISEIAKRNVINSVGNLSAKQKRLEEARFLNLRDKKYNAVKRTHKDQLAMEVAIKTTAAIEKSVKRSVLLHTKSAISDPEFHDYIDKLVTEKANDKIEEMLAEKASEDRILVLKEAFVSDEVKSLRAEVLSLREKIDEAAVDENYNRIFHSSNSNFQPDSYALMDPAPNSPEYRMVVNDDEGDMTIENIEIEPDSDYDQYLSGDAFGSLLVVILV